MLIRPHHGRALAVTAAVSASLLIAACGQKGPLYLPDTYEKAQPAGESLLSTPDKTSLEQKDEKKAAPTSY